MKKNKNHIENWGIYAAKSLHIAVVEVVIDGQIVYNPQLTFILEDLDEENSSGEAKVITLSTDHFCDDPKTALYETIKNGLLISFENINSKAIHFDEDLKEVAEYDFNEDFEEFHEENEVDVMDIMMEKKRNKPTIH